MNPQPTVSIIVNNYNYGRYLGEAIDSALAQTYPRVEVIVVDDGSTDNSREVIARYGNRIIPVLKANGGQGSALNAGFRVSTGDLILFLDSDDVLLPNAMETVAREWREGLSRIYFLLEVMSESGETREGTFGGIKAPSPLTGPYSSGMSTSGNLISRAALEKVMPIPEKEWWIGPDYYVTATTSLFGEARHLALPLGKYRIHGSNNGACQELLHQAKRHVSVDLSLYDALVRLTDGKIAPLQRWLGTSPQHYICRIKWLRESPDDYPLQDTLPSLTLRAVKAAWRQPNRSFRQRTSYSAYAFAYGALPRGITRLLGKVVRMSRVVAIKEHREEGEALERAAELSRRGRSVNPAGASNT